MDSTPQHSIPAALLDRYLAGACSADEARQVEAWAAGHDAGAALAALKGSGANADARRKAADWAAIARRTTGAAARPRPPRPAVWRPWATGAALVVGAGLVAIGLRRVGSRPARDAAPLATFATAVGQQATVTLDDGTRVTLAPSTTLRVARDFGDGARDVTLDGQAYFDVARADGAPFSVHAGRTVTRVLGTTFVVRRYAGDDAAHVAVRSGKVSVAAEGAGHAAVTLAAGQAGEATDSAATLAPASALAEETGWLDGKLVFNAASTADVLRALSRWYGYQFKLTDSTLAQRKLTIWLSTRSSTDAFASLRLLLNVDLAFDGNVVTVRPRRSAARPLHERDVRDDVTAPAREVGR